MKTKALTLLLILLLTSCFSMKAPSVYKGMSEREFRKQAKYEELIRFEEDITVYRVKFGYHADNIRFYYFYKNKLVRMNVGKPIDNFRVVVY